jgi:hypothetical protein
MSRSRREAAILPYRLCDPTYILHVSRPTSNVRSEWRKSTRKLNSTPAVGGHRPAARWSSRRYGVTFRSKDYIIHQLFIPALRFGHVDHVDQAVHMDIWGRLESGPHMVHMVHIPLFKPRG